jgi:RND family efflux transporter MFP subunit
MLFLVFADTALAADYPAPVDVDAVTPATVDEAVTVVGRVVALQSGPVAARTTAAAKTVHVQVGDVVAEGDILVTLHNNRQRSVLALAKAEVPQWAARVETAALEKSQAERDLKRLESLRNTAAFNESLFDQRQTALQAAIAKVAELEANLAYARIQVRRSQQDLDWTEVKAPYAAVVTERHIDEGAWVGLGASVVSLVSTRALEVEADIPTQYLGQLAQGAVISANVDEQALSLRLRAILPAEKALSRTRLARLAINLTPDITPPLSVNQAVKVAVPVGQVDAITVHKDAVIRNGGLPVVYKVVDGVAVMTAVQLGSAAGERLQVLSGLSEGDIVVTRGNERLQPGQKVAPRQ